MKSLGASASDRSAVGMRGSMPPLVTLPGDTLATMDQQRVSAISQTHRNSYQARIAEMTQNYETSYGSTPNLTARIVTAQTRLETAQNNFSNTFARMRAFNRVMDDHQRRNGQSEPTACSTFRL